MLDGQLTGNLNSPSRSGSGSGNGADVGGSGTSSASSMPITPDNWKNFSASLTEKQLMFVKSLKKEARNSWIVSLNGLKEHRYTQSIIRLGLVNVIDVHIFTNQFN